MKLGGIALLAAVLVLTGCAAPAPSTSDETVAAKASEFSKKVKEDIAARDAAA
jgi:PBP1b-binding outer membrane lipoprotein LpoB